jgi:hypothetical protein
MIKDLKARPETLKMIERKHLKILVICKYFLNRIPIALEIRARINK